jgi:hypothetical protein
MKILPINNLFLKNNHPSLSGDMLYKVSLSQNDSLLKPDSLLMISIVFYIHFWKNRALRVKIPARTANTVDFYN